MKASLLAVLLLLSCTGTALGPRATKLPAAGAVLPADLRQGMWLLRARLPPEPGEHLFLLDTGTDRTLLDLALAHRLGLRSADDDAVVTATGSAVPCARLEPLPLLAFGAAEFRDVDVAAIDLRKLRDHGGLPITGIAGCDLFRQCLLVVDYGAHTVRVAPRAQAPTAPPHAFTERVPHVAATLAGRELRILVDTGFQQSLALPPEIALPWRTDPHSSGEIATLDGVSPKATARVDGELQIGELRWRDPWVTLAPGAPKLGGALLRRCVLSLDAAGGRLWLEQVR